VPYYDCYIYYLSRSVETCVHTLVAKEGQGVYYRGQLRCVKGSKSSSFNWSP